MNDISPVDSSKTNSAYFKLKMFSQKFSLDLVDKIFVILVLLYTKKKIFV